jgi:hypothetical protein
MTNPTYSATKHKKGTSTKRKVKRIIRTQSFFFFFFFFGGFDGFDGLDELDGFDGLDELDGFDGSEASAGLVRLGISGEVVIRVYY